MPYLPPEGFSPYPGSHLYYRAENGSDPKTGAPCQWVTYFDPEQGTYHQVAYPTEEPRPAPTPSPISGPPPAPAPQVSTREPPQSAPAPRPKKGKGGLVATLVVLVLLIAGGLALWLTGAYTKLPFFRAGENPENPAPAASTDIPQHGDPGVPQTGSAQREALGILATLLWRNGDKIPLLGLEADEVTAMAKRYLSYSSATGNDLYYQQQRLFEMASPTSVPLASGNEKGALIPGLLALVNQAEVETRLVKETEEGSVVELTSWGRLDVSKLPEWLLALDYGQPLADYAAQYLAQNGQALADMEEHFRSDLIFSFWLEEIQARWREELYDETPRTQHITLLPDEAHGWTADYASQQLIQLLLTSGKLPMELEQARSAGVAALDELAFAASPAPTPDPSTAATLFNQVLSYSTPDQSQSVDLRLTEDGYYTLEVWYGVEVYYLWGTWDMYDDQLYLNAEQGMYDQAVLGNLDSVLFIQREPNVLTLMSSAPVGPMVVGDQLVPIDLQLISNINLTLADRLNELLPEGAQALREYAPSLSTFRSGVYIREDGNAALILDGSRSADTLDYLLVALPAPGDGTPPSGYFSPGCASGVYDQAGVVSDEAQDYNTKHRFAQWGFGQIYISSNWDSDAYQYAVPTDGLYTLVQ